MRRDGHGIIDEKGRLVRIMKRGDGSIESYYTGRDAEGVIQLEGEREFLDVDGERRYWGGIIVPLPNDRRIRLLKDFTFFSIKPDGMRIGLRKMIEYLIHDAGYSIVAQKAIVFDEILVRKMYPYFFTEDWERRLVTYLTSKPSYCFLITGVNVHHKMHALRNSLRHLLGCNGNPTVTSFVHCAERQIFAIQQALLFFSLEELIGIIGLRDIS